MIYSPEKLATFIGTVNSLQLQKVDQKMLSLPLITLDESHVWPQTAPTLHKNRHSHQSINLNNNYLHLD